MDEEDFAPWPASDPDRLDVLADELEELRLRIWRLMQNYVSDLDGAPLTRGHRSAARVVQLVGGQPGSEPCSAVWV
jgi:hypothetical protein